jgi:hypothetical protein
MNGAQAFFKALTDAGLDTCFANPGTVGSRRGVCDRSAQPRAQS